MLHEKVAEAAVVGYPHDIKGQGLYAYVTLVAGERGRPRRCARNWSRTCASAEIGPIAAPDVTCNGRRRLPKTRSGKIRERPLPGSVFRSRPVPTEQADATRMATLAARWRELVVSTPAPHRPLIEAALAQWGWLIAMVAGADAPGGGPGAEVLATQRRLLGALGASAQAPELAGDIARIESLLAAVGIDAAHALATRCQAMPLEEDDPERRLRAVYDVFVEEWESRYAALAASDEYARLQGRLVNGALRARGRAS